MKMLRPCVLAACAGLIVSSVHALEKPEVTYPIFQFPADKIPRIDGDASDWDLVPASYVVGTDQLRDDTGTHPEAAPANLDVRVRVGWVKGINRLYFLYEATDDFWDFARPGLNQDTFEIVVDGDASGGPLVGTGIRDVWTPDRVGQAAATPDDRIGPATSAWAIHSVHAQNYHIFTPAKDKDWTLLWGSPTWVKELPWANAATTWSFQQGESGRLVLEFWITPFDYAGPEGPARAVESVLEENKIIGLAWAVLDYDDPTARAAGGFWNLSPRHTMYGHASELCAFRLMPLEPALRPQIAADWRWKIVDMDRRLVAFTDASAGTITGWKWDFGDGSTSTEQHPTHAYAKPGSYVIILDITGPAGTARRSKVWDVRLK